MTLPPSSRDGGGPSPGADEVTAARLRTALAAEADAVHPDPAGLVRVRERIATRPVWRRSPLRVAAAGVAMAAVVALAVGAVGLRGSGEDALEVAGPAPSAAPPSPTEVGEEPPPSAPAAPAPATSAPLEAAPPPPGEASAAPPDPQPAAPAPLPDLATSWPYASRAEAYAARDEASAELRDPVATARTFVADVLGRPGVGTVLGTASRGAGIEVTLGRAVEGGPAVPVTRVFLVRVHEGDDAPCVVVSASAERLRVEAPQAGAVTGRPLQVAGRLSGIDEVVSVELRVPSGAQVGGGAASGGGTDTPWSVEVDPPSALSGRVLVVAATESAADGGTQELVVVPATVPRA